MVDAEPTRPNPDSLLAVANEKPRGRLKVFFGACAGVGKTYAMLQEAQRLRAQGLDVLVGVVETHGRSETAALLEGLTALPLKRIHHRNRQIREFDLDAALARRPALILMDELAHSNANGSRHPKRWQDVEELLDAGIDVLTTVNVQHLESLNDVVGGVTGIRVRETVPDHMFDEASEVVLVDLPPDDLRQRLNEGKVYIPGQAERAIEHFFRKGNLIALRELALRRTADRVDDQMRAFRDTQGRERVWHTRDAILLCIGHHAGNEKLVRTAARLAARLGCIWHAVYVETPRLHGLPEAKRRAILRTLKLAQELGAETATLSDPSEEQAVLRYAREHNLGKIIIGRRTEQHWKLRGSFADRLGKLGPDLDLVIIALDADPPTNVAKEPDSRPFTEKWRMQLRGCVAAIALCALITVLSLWLIPRFDQANLVMVYLLGVVIIALFYGRWPSVLAAVINVASFDLFFVQPHWSLAVTDVQYLLTFGVMLIVGIVVGNLTAGVRYQAKIARYREQRARHLYEMSRSLSRALTPEDIAKTSRHFLSSSFQAKTSLLLPQEEGHLQPIMPDEGGILSVDDAIAHWSFDKGAPAGAGTDTLPGVPYQLLPLTAAQQTYGVLAIEPANLRQLMVPEQQRLLQTFTSLIANALERLHLARSAELAKLDAEREQLRNSLLAALSHDLRTPLTVLFGQAEILTLDLAAEGSRHAPQANQIRQQVLSTTRLVNNLLDMARIQSGGFNLRKEWQSLEEIIGSALHMLETTLSQHQIRVELPDEMVLINCDASLLERVFINLLENAHKYAGHAALLGIRAEVKGEWLNVDVWDNGPGVTIGQENLIFDKFSRGNKESAIPGVGLGLAICRAIIDVHGGRIWVEKRQEGGASFRFVLPLEKAPEIDADNIDTNNIDTENNDIS
ncbi:MULTISPECIES: two-component system sensor histidine kinase KdpD [Yersinia pseudotuberculosis complex]|uniref:histidine kinase n=1 Tax=Yersinia pseudotuberculosis serotype O:1b (strain IP 31758) TaxID=349747 RepID=A0A0U1QXB6_YERP3|nr:MULTISPECIES: two-component system sensor histidine kinase KdpD [Yersinia pseudotuberculosis complex]ABS47281.1 sensor protein KdpD [Yersinia pseudotuberculosis IP 31758]MCE4112186.1 two-component system sensor histidine kinase KdpD [Yersinia pseudotuberculosis]MCF1162938.1 two-component system sensor histidine kinase KdpD [Yersinia pseudotuberculosis]RYC27723.1 two-component system sensor histidine kinase KdbD [Yersinia pseudotuberculosis]UFA60751.1 Osmosensitive K(+) channel histidine kin